MKIKFAKDYGFCMGVTRAVDIVDQQIEKTPVVADRKIWTFGPLIHNETYMNKIAEQGVSVATETTKLGEKDTVILRTHGLAPNQKARLSATQATIIDATCPKVAHSQKLITEFTQANPDSIVLIAGDRNHGEVEALCGYATYSVVLENANQASAWIAATNRCEPQGSPLLLLAQTTFSPEAFSQIIDVFKKASVENITVKETICRATEMRQKALKELLPHVDAVLVIGGKESANTKRLANIALEAGKPTYLIENSYDLPESLLLQKKSNNDFVLGVTAGASTPKWVIEEVIFSLQNIN